ncbi:hypothetical protein TUM17377_05320 [Shewanella chilikensis]|nr:hypothetical protein TUM17377_05320 [Shewanella chilikensis]
MVQESGINELEITEGQEAVRIRRFGPQQPQACFSIGNDSVQVLAPVAGTFYAAPATMASPWWNWAQKLSRAQYWAMCKP